MNFFEFLAIIAIVSGAVYLGCKGKFALAFWLLFLGFGTIEYFVKYK